MNCTNCGNKLNREDTHCSICGLSYNLTELQWEEDIEGSDLPEPEEDHAEPEVPTRHRMIFLVILITGIILSVAAILMMMVPLFLDDTNQLNHQLGASNVKASTNATYSATENADLSITNVSDISAEYDSDKSVYNVFFGLKNKEGDYITASSGTVNLSITNSENELVYDQDYSLTESYFTTWTNIYWNSARLLASIPVSLSDIEAGSSSIGELQFSIQSSGFTLKDYAVTMTDLPVKDVMVYLPKTPVTIAQYLDGKIRSAVDVTDVTYDSVYNSFDGLADVTFQIQSVPSAIEESNVSLNSTIAYTVKDSAGTVVDSGEVSIQAASLKDTTITSLTVYSLKILETYSLELSDVKN